MKILAGSSEVEGYTYLNDTLRYKGRLYISTIRDLRTRILQELHNSGNEGHSGQRATLKRIEQFFYWPSLTKDVILAVKECIVCQKNKPEHIPYLGLLQPIPVLTKPLSDIVMDFIEGLPTSDYKNSILVVVDKFAKYAHFIAFSHLFIAQDVANAYFSQVHKLHGLPKTITSDSDTLFLSQFWSQLFKLLGTKLKHSTAYHPQPYGQIERINQCLETFLRCMTSDKPKHWAKWITMAEWWYNTTYHTAFQHTPFEVLYGYPPPHLSILQVPASTNSDVKQYIQERKIAMQSIRARLLEAQQRMKFYVDKHRSERTFEVGDQAFLRLQPY